MNATAFRRPIQAASLIDVRRSDDSEWSVKQLFQYVLLSLLLSLGLTACGGSSDKAPPKAPPHTAPMGLTYRQGWTVYPVGSPITLNTPTSTYGTITHYSITPTLPLGLSLDPHTGVINGTPTRVATKGVYTVIGRNPAGMVMTQLKIQVVEPRTWLDIEPMNTGRTYHTATLLTGKDGKQKMLVAGGLKEEHSFLGTAEVYNPATRDLIPVGNMNEARAYHTATLVMDQYGKQKVLVTGGHGFDSNLETAELYDPASKKWTRVSSMHEARFHHTATLIKDSRDKKEKVLVAGGVGDNRTELYELATGLWTSIGDMDAGQSGHTVTMLADGNVLVTGIGSQDGSAVRLYVP